MKPGAYKAIIPMAYFIIPRLFHEDILIPIYVQQTIDKPVKFKATILPISFNNFFLSST